MRVCVLADEGKGGDKVEGLNLGKTGGKKNCGLCPAFPARLGLLCSSFRNTHRENAAGLALGSIGPNSIQLCVHLDRNRNSKSNEFRATEDRHGSKLGGNYGLTVLLQ